MRLSLRVLGIPIVDLEYEDVPDEGIDAVVTSDTSSRVGFVRAGVEFDKPQPEDRR